jgi:hypothetical protein
MTLKFLALQAAPYIYIYIYDMSRLRVKNSLFYVQVCGLYAVHSSQWPRVLKRRSAASRLLKFWVRIPPGAWMHFCCDCCVLLGRGLWDELIIYPEESYWLWCVAVCDLETSWMRRPWATWGFCAKYKMAYISIITIISYIRGGQLNGLWKPYRKHFMPVPCRNFTLFIFKTFLFFNIKPVNFCELWTSFL